MEDLTLENSTAKHADMFDQLINSDKTYIEYEQEQKAAEAAAAVPEEPVEPEKPETVVLNGKEYRSDHLFERNGVQFVKPEYRYLYEGSGFIYGGDEAGKNLGEDVFETFKGTLQKLSAPGLGLIDFGVDVGTSISNRLGINAESINRQWDTMTRFDDPNTQKFREFVSVAGPSMMGAGLISKGLALTKLPFLAKFGIGALGVAGTDAAIISVSDEGAKPEGIVGNLGKMFPDLFGVNGIAPLPQYADPNDPDAAAKNKAINRLDAIGFSFIGDLVGLAFAGGGRKIMSWMKPRDETAKVYKAAEVVKSDPETVIRVAEIDQALATKPSAANAKVLTDERERLLKQLEETGSSEVTTKEPLERYIEVAEESRRVQLDEEAILKLEAGPATYGSYIPEVTPGLASPAELARQTIMPGNVARNMADVAAIKIGVAAGDPAPLLSGPMLKKGLVLGQSRKAVQGLAEASRAVGNFDATVGKFRMTKKMMDNAYDKIYADIIRAGDANEVRRMFVDNRSAIPLADGTIVEPLNPMQERAAGVAIRDLIDMFLGRDVTQTSARVMDTLGREIQTIAEAQKQFRNLVDDDRVQEIILDKLEFLMNEYGLNKYIAGWQLQNQNWFNRLSKSDNPEELANLINEEFTTALTTKQASVKRFVDELRRVGKEDPQMVKALFDAFSDSNGDVDTIAKLMAWASTQVNPTGMLISANPRKMNLFARTLWGIGMNNVLSIVSAANAVKGSLTKIILQPIEGLIGHGIEAVSTQSMEPVKRAMYYYGAVWETQRRALGDAVTRAKKVHHDYDFLMEQIRSDYKIEKTKDWDLLDAAATQWEKEGNFGKLSQYWWTKANQAVAEMPWMRTAMTGMSGVDAYTDTIQAAQIARVRAYDDVFSKAGEVNPELLMEAEKQFYRTMFNADGVLTDAAAKNASGEVALNLDDGLASFVNRGVEAVPGIKPLFFFPKTAMNDIKQQLSYTPLMAIPGMNKYSKVLSAGDDIEKIKAALAEHGIKNFDATPNAMAIYKKLQAEYRGRVVLGTTAAIVMYGYAASGNIRGNGPVNAAERQKLRQNYNWQPKTINIGGKWVSYKGIPMLDPVLTLIGDLAYYSNDIDRGTFEDKMDKIGWTFSATFINNTPLAGVEPFLAAVNGDENAWNRLTSNLIRTFIPQSGNLGIVSNAITSSLKDIYGDLEGTVMNRLPGLSSQLPEQIDLWTGKPINDIDNLFLRGLNAVSPIKVSNGSEPWRKWLLSTGFDGIGRIRFSSEGGYEYDAETRERLGQLIGEQQLYKEIEKIMNNPRFNREIDEMRAYRQSGATLEDIRIKTEKLDLYTYLNGIVNEAKKNAEAKLFEERPDIRAAVLGQMAADELLGRGDVKGAASTAQKFQKQSKELLKRKNR